MIKDGLTTIRDDLDALRFQAPGPARDVDAVLTALQVCAASVRAGSPTPPNWIKVSVGDVVLEVAWRADDATVAGFEPIRTMLKTSVSESDSPDRPVPPAGVESPAVIGSPAVGTFYRAAEPGAAPFVEVGDSVVPGQQVATLEVTKLMMPVESTVAGVVVAVLKADATAVEYGEALFKLSSSEVDSR